MLDWRTSAPLLATMCCGLHALFAGWWSLREGWAAFVVCIGGASGHVLLVVFVARAFVYALVALLFVVVRGFGSCIIV